MPSQPTTGPDAHEDALEASARPETINVHIAINAALTDASFCQFPGVRLGMQFHISKHDMECSGAYQELMVATAEADIRTGHGEALARPALSNISFDLYKAVVQQAEAGADEDAAQLESQDSEE
jgi:hypothetical protein